MTPASEPRWPAGWYRESGPTRTEHYWDGVQWTGTRRWLPLATPGFSPSEQAYVEDLWSTITGQDPSALWQTLLWIDSDAPLPPSSSRNWAQLVMAGRLLRPRFAEMVSDNRIDDSTYRLAIGLLITSLAHTVQVALHGEYPGGMVSIVLPRLDPEVRLLYELGYIWAEGDRDWIQVMFRV